MKPISKAQLLTDRETLTRENCVLGSALNYLARDEFQFIGKSHHHTVKLAGATDAHGGIVLLTFSPPGQRPYTTAQYFDDWFSYWRDYIPSHTNDEAITIRELAYAAKRAHSQAWSDLEASAVQQIPA